MDDVARKLLFTGEERFLRDDDADTATLRRGSSARDLPLKICAMPIKQDSARWRRCGRGASARARRRAARRDNDSGASQRCAAHAMAARKRFDLFATATSHRGDRVTARWQNVRSTCCTTSACGHGEKSAIPARDKRYDAECSRQRDATGEAALMKERTRSRGCAPDYGGGARTVMARVDMRKKECGQQRG